MCVLNVFRNSIWSSHKESRPNYLWKDPLKVKDVFLWSILRDKEREGGAGDTPFPIKAGNSGL